MYDHLVLYSRNQHRLILTILQHIMIGIIANREDVRGHLRTAFSPVCKDNLLCVNGESSVRIDGYTEKT